MTIVNSKRELEEAIKNGEKEIKVTDKIFLAEMIAVNKLQDLKATIINKLTTRAAKTTITTVFGDTRKCPWLRPNQTI